MKPIQMLLPPNQKVFSQYSSEFWESPQNFDYLEKTMSLRGYLFLKLSTAKSGVT